MQVAVCKLLWNLYGKPFIIFVWDQPTCERESDEATSAKRKRGINFETDPRNAAFFKVIEFLEESDEEHLTMKQCKDKMKKFIDES